MSSSPVREAPSATAGNSHPESGTAVPPLSARARRSMLVCVFLALLFDGVELGLMPIASLSVSKSLLGDAFTPALGGDWFARFTAALMLGAAIGGIVLGSLGDRIGRTTGMGISILFYSLFAGAGGWATTQEQMLAARFFVGLGVGGLWPNGMALVCECWPGANRPLVSGVMSAALNAGILLLSQLARYQPITPESWRWLFQLSGIPALLGLAVLLFLSESPQWLASRGKGKAVGNSPRAAPLRELFGAELWRTTFAAVLVSAIPLVGAWAASKWMIPWADKVAGSSAAGYKAATQGWWALGATLGSFIGAQAAVWLGRRRAYALISVGATVLTISMFQGTRPMTPSFHPIVFAQGLVATLYFGWLAVYLPELFPTRVRATGTGLAYNAGRFATAAGVLAAGSLFAWLGGDYPRVGTVCSLVYAAGLFAIWLAPEPTEPAKEA